MLSLIASIALFRGQDQPPRLRTVLENNSIIMVEPMPKESTISVQLFASAKYVPETEANHGFRHLIEHLILRGDGTLDRKLESQACFATAKTLRDAMQIEITVGPSQLPLAIETLGTILRKPTFTQASIDNEMKIMRDELAMEDDPLLLSSASWKAAYGDAGLDPLGDFDSMYRATPEKLAETFDRQFAGDGLVLAIAGPVDIDKATDLGKSLLGPYAKSHFQVSTPVRTGKPGRTSSEGFGECRGAIVPGFNLPQSMAALAAALAVASEVPNCFVTYTPTVQPGLVLVGRTESASGVGMMIEGMTSPASYYGRGRMLAKEWVQRQLRTPSGDAYLRGLLLCQGASYRPEMMLEEIDAMTPTAFEEGMKALTASKAVVTVGAK